jgi:hypothetical protein
VSLLKVLYRKRDAARAEVDKWARLIKTLETELNIKPQKTKSAGTQWTPAARARAASNMKKMWKTQRAKMLKKKVR